MKAYDFDKTIYPHESGTQFFRYCARRRPRVLLRLPLVGLYGLLRLLRLISLKRLKEVIFGYLGMLEDVELLVAQFWDTQQDQIPAWLPPLLPEGGLVLSASPEFLVQEQCRRMGLACIGTRMDPHTGRISGENCKGKEKVRRFHAAYPGAAVEAFYSDSLSDTPMACLAEKAWLVKGDALQEWPVTAGNDKKEC